MEVLTLRPRHGGLTHSDDVIAYLVERAEYDPQPPRSQEVADAVGCDLGEAVAVLRSLTRAGTVRWAHGGWQLIARAEWARSA